MDHYTLLRHFADSWFLLVMFLAFSGIIIWVIFSKSRSYRDSANMIFRHEDSPDEDGPVRGKESGK